MTKSAGKIGLSSSDTPRRHLLVSAVIIVTTFLSMQTHAEATLLVVGPAESVDLARGTIVVLGQPVGVSSRTQFLAVGASGAKALASAGQRAIRQIEIGRMVAVWSEDGMSASAVLVSRDRSIPGASQVYLSGVATSVDLLRGYATVGATRVDLTATLAGGSLDLITGERLQVLGTQPSPFGVVLATEISSARTNGIGGTSANGIGGTSVNGIGGTSTNGIGGTSNGIGGTSAKVNGIGGTSANGIGGTSNGIGGTSAKVNGIGGTSAKVNGIGGTSTDVTQ